MSSIEQLPESLGEMDNWNEPEVIALAWARPNRIVVPKDFVQPDIRQHWQTEKPPKSQRARSIRALNLVTEVSLKTEQKLIGQLHAGDQEEDWAGLDAETTDLLYQMGWLRPRFDIGTLEALWSDHIIGESDRNLIFRELWHKRRAGMKQTLLVYRLPRLLGEFWKIERERAKEREHKKLFPEAIYRPKEPDTDIVDGMPVGLLYRGAIGIMREADRVAMARHRIKLQRVTLSGDHDPHQYFYVWRVLNQKEAAGKEI